MGVKGCLRAADDASKLPLRGAALRTAHAIESNAGAGTGPVRGGLSSRRKKVVLGGSADASGVEDAQKLLQKCKPKAGAVLASVLQDASSCLLRRFGRFDRNKLHQVLSHRRETRRASAAVS